MRTGMGLFSLSRHSKAVVGVGRFELTTPCAQGRCATRLRSTPRPRPAVRSSESRAYTQRAPKSKASAAGLEYRVDQPPAGLEAEPPRRSSIDLENGLHGLVH